MMSLRTLVLGTLLLGQVVFLIRPAMQLTGRVVSPFEVVISALRATAPQRNSSRNFSAVKPPDRQQPSRRPRTPGALECAHTYPEAPEEQHIYRHFIPKHRSPSLPKRKIPLHAPWPEHGHKCEPFAARHGDWQPRFGDCALVGGSPSLMHEQRGREIDGHDAVLRVNAHGLTPQFAPYTGTKTTALVVVGTDIMLSIGRNRSRETALIFTSRFAKQYAAMLDEQRRDPDGPQRLGLASPCVRARSELVVRHLKPSCGMEGLLLALLACETVDLYGFREAFMSGGKVHFDVLDASRESYADRSLYGVHKILAERQLIRRWVGEFAAEFEKAPGWPGRRPSRPRLRLMCT
jgi:hypothetical protein